MNKHLKSEFDKLKGKGADAFSDIPEAYFDTFAEKTINKNMEVQTARKRKFFYTAVAASLLVIMSLTIVLFQWKDDGTRNVLAENKTELISSEDTSKQIDRENTIPLSDTTGGNQREMVDFDLLFDEVPLETIIEYLNEMDEFEF